MGDGEHRGWQAPPRAPLRDHRGQDHEDDVRLCSQEIIRTITSVSIHLEHLHLRAPRLLGYKQSCSDAYIKYFPHIPTLYTAHCTILSLRMCSVPVYTPAFAKPKVSWLFAARPSRASPPRHPTPSSHQRSLKFPASSWDRVRALKGARPLRVQSSLNLLAPPSPRRHPWQVSRLLRGLVCWWLRPLGAARRWRTMGRM